MTQKRYWLVQNEQFQEVNKEVAVEALLDSACDCVLMLEWMPNTDAIPALKRLELNEENL